MEIRSVELRDYEQAENMMQKLSEMHVKNRPDLYARLEGSFYTKEDLKEMIQDEKYILLIGEINGQAAGICFSELREQKNRIGKRSIFVNALWVEEQYRGTGLGRRLLEKTEEKAKELGAERLELIVSNFNKGARKFYDRFGMTEQRTVLEKKL